MRVAVLGAGITGVCAALELADRGLGVDLYEQDAQLVSRASYWNEGKIHLGLVYAQDKSRRTAHTMIEGAMRFRPLIARWIDTETLDRAVSDPFAYAVHRRTMTPPAAVEAHFHSVADICRSVGRQPGTQYVAPLEGWIWRPADTGTLFSAEEVVAAYLTEERSIDPFVVAAGLRSAVAASPRITVLANTMVEKVSGRDGTGFTVVSVCEGHAHSEVYGAVINALWQNRLGIDASLGLEEDRPVLHRFKVGLHSKPAFVTTGLPTVTFVLGPFGDIVNFGHRAYVSWYPAGHLLTSMERIPLLTDAELLGADLSQVEAESLDAVARLIPGHARLLRGSSGQWEFGGGYITAWGTTGIHDERSRLHERFEVGVHSTGSYHSVDTGKYTAGPYLADCACDRILPRRVAS